MLPDPASYRVECAAGDEPSTKVFRTVREVVQPRGAFVLEVTQGPDQPYRVELDGHHPTRMLVGQSPACELRLTDPEVSRRHAAVEVVGDRLRVTDLGSTNGTYVGGLSIREVFLRGGESVRVGSTVLAVTRASCELGSELPTRTTFGHLVGASDEMRRLYPLCEKLANANVPVIIEGETGTGKEVLAESLHEQGPLSQQPFVVFDCTAVPPALVESELFGHVRGAFTGAVAARKGVFEQAEGGTLLIDEIGDLELALQPKLLRAIERSEIRRVGGDRAIRVHVRILAATRRDLDHEVQAGLFRDDLFHRLAVARIELPPLRERHGDVTVLAKYFCLELGADESELDRELLMRWEGYDWPGNVRELRNAVARHLALGDLAPEGTGSSRSPKVEDFIDPVLSMDLPIKEARDRVIAEFERRYLSRALAKHNGVVTHAAKASGIARRHFQRLRVRRKS
jgi:two-component system, NtrC family, response regulator HydG